MSAAVKTGKMDEMEGEASSDAGSVFDMQRTECCTSGGVARLLPVDHLVETASASHNTTHTQSSDTINHLHTVMGGHPYNEILHVSSYPVLYQAYRHPTSHPLLCLLTALCLLCLLDI